MHDAHSGGMHTRSVPPLPWCPPARDAYQISSSTAMVSTHERCIPDQFPHHHGSHSGEMHAKSVSSPPWCPPTRVHTRSIPPPPCCPLRVDAYHISSSTAMVPTQGICMPNQSLHLHGITPPPLTRDNFDFWLDLGHGNC